MGNIITDQETGPGLLLALSLLLSCLIPASAQEPSSLRSLIAKDQPTQVLQMVTDTSAYFANDKARAGFSAATTTGYSQDFALRAASLGGNFIQGGIGYEHYLFEEKLAPAPLAGLAAPADARTDSANVKLEGQFAIGMLQVQPRLTAGADWYGFSRPDVFSGARATGAAGGWHVAAELDLFADFMPLPGVLLRPIAGFDLYHATINPFQETGAGAFNASVDRAEATWMRTELGALAAVTLSHTKRGTLLIGGTLQWLHNFETGAISADAQLANGTPLGQVALFPGLDKNGMLVNGGILWTTPTGF